MSEYDYAKIIARSEPAIELLCGAIMQEIVVQVVDPEFNVVFMKTDKGSFAIQGAIGSEIVEVVGFKGEFPAITSEEGTSISRHPAFDQFIGRQIASVRQIGEAWNGHGFEISFTDIFNATMIVQSIYSPPKPNELEDCLRLGVASYQTSTEQDSAGNGGQSR